MSGNPFRASQLLPNPAAAAPAPSIGFINADSGSSDGTARDWDSGNASPPLPAKTKKSVRIESPPSSPPHPAIHDADDPLVPRINRGHHAGSLSPTSPAGFSDNFEDQDLVEPFYRGGQGNDAYRAQDMVGRPQRETGWVAHAQPFSGAPVNPFSRTLATIEPQDRSGMGPGHAAKHSKDRAAAEKPGPETPKANLDVEGFKRLLMTGIHSSPSNSGQSSQIGTASNPIAPPIFESSSSTDTSSISRQSLFEPALQEPHIDTPRTSYEMAASDDETISLVADVKKTEKKKPPPAPKHRHGKLVTSRTPQTVSFSDFTATEAITPPISRIRTNSDLNKPLPPTPSVISPPAHIISQDVSQEESQEERPAPEMRATSASSEHSDTPSSQKRVPPPVPLARRQSQLRASNTSNRSRSNSNLTMSSQHSTDFPSLSPSIGNDTNAFTPQKAPPPPPPARRHGASLTGGNPSSATSSTTELPGTESARRANVSSPNPPSSRKSTLSSPPPSPVPGEAGLARASSVSSNRTNSRAVSNESATMPPPPPPPRRRQSTRTSLDKERPHYHGTSPTESRRTSSENKRSSFDGRRTSVASESSLRYEYAPVAGNEHVLYSPKEEVDEPQSMEPLAETRSDSTNILDDMERFQKEIDQLRERYQKG